MPDTLPSPFPAWVGFGQARIQDRQIEAALPAERASLPAASAPRRRITFELGRIAARRAAASIGFQLGPVLAGLHGAPQWPTPMLGSITHVDDFAMAAIVSVHEAVSVGLDIEDVNSVGDDGIAALIADPDERRWIDEDPGRLVALFSAKEAVFKAFYPFEKCFFDFDVVHLDATPLGFVARLRTALGGWGAGYEFGVVSRRYADLVLSSVLLPRQGVPLELAER